MSKKEKQQRWDTTNTRLSPPDMPQIQTFPFSLTSLDVRYGHENTSGHVCTQKSDKLFQTTMIIDRKNGCHPVILPVSTLWEEVCATQCDLATLLFKMWGLGPKPLTLAGSMTCTVKLKWQKQCGATSKLRLQETYLLLLIHWAPCLCHLNKPQANKKKTKGKREGSSQMSPRYVRQPSQDWQS